MDQWNHVPFISSIFLCCLFTRHFKRQYLKVIVSVFFSVFDLMNCCKFQRPMMKPILKESVAININYEIKCLNTRWCFMSMKIMYAKWCYLTYCWYWRHKNIQKIVLHYPLLSSLNKNSTTVYIYLMLQFIDENEASYFYIQGAR